MTPERLAEIRRWHEGEVEVAAYSDGFPGELTEEVQMIGELLDALDAATTDGGTR